MIMRNAEREARTCVVTVVRSEENVSVVQLLYVYQCLYQLLHHVIYRQKGLPPYIEPDRAVKTPRMQVSTNDI